MERKKDLKHFRDLEVYQLAFHSAMEIFEITKLFPIEERYSLTDQIIEIGMLKLGRSLAEKKIQGCIC